MAWELLLLIWDRGDPRSLCPDLRTYVRCPFVHQDFVIRNKIRLFVGSPVGFSGFDEIVVARLAFVEWRGEWGSLLAGSLQAQ